MKYLVSEDIDSVVLALDILDKNLRFRKDIYQEIIVTNSIFNPLIIFQEIERKYIHWYPHDYKFPKINEFISLLRLMITTIEFVVRYNSTKNLKL